MSSSTKLVFTGEQIGWTTKTSRSLTFSRIRTKMFSFLNSNTCISPSGMHRWSQIPLASAGWALPENTFSSSIIVPPQSCRLVPACRAQYSVALHYVKSSLSHTRLKNMARGYHGSIQFQAFLYACKYQTKIPLATGLFMRNPPNVS